jgi:hypothetical protein
VRGLGLSKDFPKRNLRKDGMLADGKIIYIEYQPLFLQPLNSIVWKSYPIWINMSDAARKYHWSITDKSWGSESIFLLIPCQR